MASAVANEASTSRVIPLEDARPVHQRRVRISIAHSQLRDLVHSPRQRGLIYTVQGKSIVQYDLRHSKTSTSNVPKKTMIQTLRFSPNALAFSPNSDVYATAGSKAEIFVGSLPTPAAPETWSSQFHVPGRTISNAVLWAPLPYAPDEESPKKLERLVISNNDETVKMYNVDTSPRRDSESRIEVAGDIKIGTPVNHTSVSPDGRTLLSVGDAPFIHLHALSTHTRNVAFTSLHKVSTSTNSHPPHPSYQGLFTSAFSPCSRMLAVGSQDGVVSVWDVRYLKDRLAILRTEPRPTKKFSGIQTTQTELSRWGMLLGQGSGLLRHFASDDIVALLGWDDEDYMGKTYGVRSLKFSHDRRGDRGVLVFSEHTSNIHVVDARTFDGETRRVINLPSVLRRHRLQTESPKPMDSNTETMELDNDPPPVVPRPEPERPTGPQRTVTIVDLPTPEIPTPEVPTPARRSPRLAPSSDLSNIAGLIELFSPTTTTTTQPDSDSEVALRAIENLIVRNLASEPIHRRDLGLPFVPLPPTPSPPDQLGPFTLPSQSSALPRPQERPVPVESQFLEALQRYRNSLVSPPNIPITSRQATSSPQALPSPPLVSTRRTTGAMPILGPDITMVTEPASEVTGNTLRADPQPSFPTDLRESMNSRAGSGSNTPAELPALTPPLRRTNDSTLPELEAAVRRLSVPAYENMLANLDAGVQRLELLRRQRMEMQARYNSSPRLQPPPVSASNLASPGPSTVLPGQGAQPAWNPERTSEWDRLLSEQDDQTHRNVSVPMERDRYDRRPLIQHHAPNLPDPINNAEGPAHGAELRRRRTIRVAHEPHIVWEEPRVVNSTRKPVLDNAAREWSPEDVALLDEWEEMQCDITGFSFCDGAGGEGSDWLYVGTQGRILEFRGLGLGALLDGEEGEAEDGARSDLWARRWS